VQNWVALFGFSVGEAYARVEVVPAEVRLQDGLSVARDVIDQAQARRDVVERNDARVLGHRDGAEERGRRTFLRGKEDSIPVIANTQIQREVTAVERVVHEHAVVAEAVPRVDR
jgi:hypothetical protein